MNAAKVVGTNISGTLIEPLEVKPNEYNWSSPGNEPDTIAAVSINIPPSAPAKKYLPVFNFTMK